LQDSDLNTALAQSGIVVAALDFRMPPVASYPASLVDINYAIRWLKTRAPDFGGRPDWVGAFGISSEGHMAMLTGCVRRIPNMPRSHFQQMHHLWMRAYAACSWSN